MKERRIVRKIKVTKKSQGFKVFGKGEEGAASPNQQMEIVTLLPTFAPCGNATFSVLVPCTLLHRPRFNGAVNCNVTLTLVNNCVGSDTVKVPVLPDTMTMAP